MSPADETSVWEETCRRRSLPTRLEGKAMQGHVALEPEQDRPGPAGEGPYAAEEGRDELLGLRQRRSETLHALTADLAAKRALLSIELEEQSQSWRLRQDVARRCMGALSPSAPSRDSLLSGGSTRGHWVCSEADAESPHVCSHVRPQGVGTDEMPIADAALTPLLLRPTQANLSPFEKAWSFLSAQLQTAAASAAADTQERISSPIRGTREGAELPFMREWRSWHAARGDTDVAQQADVTDPVNGEDRSRWQESSINSPAVSSSHTDRAPLASSFKKTTAVRRTAESADSSLSSLCLPSELALDHSQPSPVDPRSNPLMSVPRLDLRMVASACSDSEGVQLLSDREEDRAAINHHAGIAYINKIEEQRNSLRKKLFETRLVAHRLQQDLQSEKDARREEKEKEMRRNDRQLLLDAEPAGWKTDKTEAREGMIVASAFSAVLFVFLAAMYLDVLMLS